MPSGDGDGEWGERVVTLPRSESSLLIRLRAMCYVSCEESRVKTATRTTGKHKAGGKRTQRAKGGAGAKLALWGVVGGEQEKEMRAAFSWSLVGL
jgi:hypothetical protein